eukprot:TRINITY_DN37755_c0_g1_i1.p1 TRINITY_DN37755_c0_g1~~TRINITY_DN37755_c0_g1_i1.p1  ORF type:complete len:312 (+),score=58.58 TRINITY_DN37755_c0_g1_i1:101-1036(+)
MDPEYALDLGGARGLVVLWPLWRRLHGLRLAWIPMVVGAGTFCSLITCYGLAVAAGHARAMLPMLSDCIVRSPESYIGSWGMMIFTCLGLCLNVLAMDGYVGRFPIAACPCLHGVGPSPESCGCGCGFGGLGRRASLRLRGCARAMGLSACVGFGVATVVTERDNNLLHCIGAIFGFFSYFVYALTVTGALYCRRSEGAVSSTSLRLKVACNALGVLAMLFYATLLAKGAVDPRWGGRLGDQAVALCEWTAIYCMAMFNLSFKLEYGDELRFRDIWPDLPSKLWPLGPGDPRADLLLPVDPELALRSAARL